MALTPKSIRVDSLYDNQAGYPENFSRASRLTGRIPATNQKVPTTLYMTGYVDPSLQKKKKKDKKRIIAGTSNPAVASRSKLARLTPL